MESIDLTKDDEAAPAVTDLTQDSSSDDEPPTKRAKADPTPSGAASPATDLAQLRREREARRSAPPSTLTDEQKTRIARNKAAAQAKRAKVISTPTRTLQLRTHPDQLRTLWRDVTSEGLIFPVIPFYGHTRGAYACFSNFFASEFEFTLPASCSATPRTLRVAFGEQAIMACKAAAMGDWTSYDTISRSNTNPKTCKALGRKVKPFRQDVWTGVVVEVAIEIATQKFGSDPALWKVLNATGDRVLAEMRRYDRHWGTGVDRTHANEQSPSTWLGTNILGYALMVARGRLRARPVAEHD